MPKQASWRLAFAAAALGAALGAPAWAQPAADAPAIVKAGFDGDLALVKAEIAKGVSPDTRDSNGDSAMTWATDKGHLEIVKLLIASKANVSTRDNSGHAGLHYAALNGHLAVVRLLVENGADVNLASNAPDKHTPLYEASLNGHTPVAAYLIQRGAKAEMVDKEFKSPLFWAAKAQKGDFVQLLLKSGASGANALVTAARVNDMQALSGLLSNGVSVNVRDAKGDTALMQAARSNGAETVGALLAWGADPNIATNEQVNMTTPLMWAAYHCNLGAVKLLRDRGANRGARNPGGDTAYDLARSGWTTNMQACPGDVLGLLTP